jgi:rhamnulose-1-phosphate aldolase
MLEITKYKKFEGVFSEVKHTAGLIWEKGWAEANAGNFSLNITNICRDSKFSFKGTSTPLNRKYSYLKNNFFLISLSGSRMRDISNNPEKDICIIYIDKSGNHYNILKTAGGENGKPSSELFSHLEIHNKLIKSNRKEKAVLHTHPAEVIALTRLKKFCNEKSINKLLFSIQPEVAVLFSEGVGFVPYYRTGSEKLAKQTGKKFKKHNFVLWEKHGCVSSGTDLDDAFDKTDIIVKSLKIFFMSSLPGNKADGLNVYQIKDLKKIKLK